MSVGFLLLSTPSMSWPWSWDALDLHSHSQSGILYSGNFKILSCSQFNSGYFGAKLGSVSLCRLEKWETIFYPFRKARSFLSSEVAIETVDKCSVEWTNEEGKGKQIKVNLQLCGAFPASVTAPPGLAVSPLPLWGTSGMHCLIGTSIWITSFHCISNDRAGLSGSDSQSP